MSRPTMLTKTLLLTLCGFALGGIVPPLLTIGCSCPPGPRDIPVIAAGTYKLTPRGYPSYYDLAAADMASADTDHQLVVTQDQMMVIETFSRNGKTYELRYQITGTEG